jgi:hypothetical protein
LIIHSLLFLPAFGAGTPATSSPVTGQTVKQLLPCCGRCGRLVDHYDVETDQLRLVLPERFPDDTLYCVSRCRFTAMFL